jgi:hypothetical protein
MKCLYFDCFAGASGDMVVGAMIDLGLDFQLLSSELKKLPISGYEIFAHHVEKNHISATRFEVKILSQDSSYLPADEITHKETHNHSNELLKQDTSGDPHSTHKTLPEVLEVLSRSDLSPQVKNTASNIFQKLGEAEAKIHNQPIEEIHFHEVGEIDAIVDIVSASIGLEWLNVDQVILSPIHLGSGFVNTSHGLLPVPAPATAEILKDLPVYTTQTRGELITPTGAAILSSVATGTGPLPVMTIRKTGYGAGKRDHDFPNVLRLILGDLEHRSYTTDQLSFSRDPYPEQHDVKENFFGVHQGLAMILETNLDDMNPQLYGNLMEELLKAGALDVVFIPVQMKKNRPGIKVEVMIPPDQEDRFLSIIFKETTTIGIRSYEVMKHMLQREILPVQTHFGLVRMKVSRLGNKIVNFHPEYEDCLKLALKHEISVKEVISDAIATTQPYFLDVGK